MTEQEQIAMIQIMNEEKSVEVISAYLKLAGEKIVRRAFPYDSSPRPVPEKYHYNQIEIANYLLNKRGAEGETAHSSNGMSRSYENGDVPYSMMQDIVPFIGVL